MAGFLDAGERVIDLVLTDTGKQLLLNGKLRFAYWIPFDDEVNYQPVVTVDHLSGTLPTPDDITAAITAASQSMLEDPIIREASYGYRGLNDIQEDTTNLQRPLFTAVPGVGHISPIPEMIVSTDTATVQVTQYSTSKRMVRKNELGNIVATSMYDDGFRRIAGQGTNVDITYSTGSFSPDQALEGFLVTMYQNVSGTLKEVVHNAGADGQVAYLNDLSIRLG